MYIKINGPSLEEVEDIFRSLALIGHQTVRRSPPGQIGVVAGGEAGPGGHPGVTRLGRGGGLGAGACLSSHIAEVLLDGGHRISCWVLSKGDGAGQSLDWYVAIYFEQWHKLRLLLNRFGLLDSSQILLFVGSRHIGRQ